MTNPSFREILSCKSLFDFSEALEQWLDSHPVNLQGSPNSIYNSAHQYTQLLKALFASEALNTLYTLSEQRDALSFRLNNHLASMMPLPLDPDQIRIAFKNTLSDLRCLAKEARQHPRSKSPIYPPR